MKHELIERLDEARRQLSAAQTAASSADPTIIFAIISIVIDVIDKIVADD